MFIITLVARTTQGIHAVVSDPMSAGEAQDHISGMIAAVGSDNVVSLLMQAVPV